MEVGLHIPQVGRPATRANVESFVKSADAAGFDGLWVYDHVVLQKEQQSQYPYSPDGSLGFSPTSDFLEPLTLLTWVAGMTKRAKLGTSVLVMPMRQPVLHAKIMATIDFLSGGRFVLGAGVGWWKQEFEALSVPFSRRGARMDECLQLLRSLWTDDFSSFRGEFYEAVDWACNPKPVQAGGIPIWLGGESRKGAERIGKYADGWLATPKSLPTLAEDFAVAKEAAVKAGRDPGKLVIAMESGIALSADRLEKAAERLTRLKEMGIVHAVANVHPAHLMAAPAVIEEFAVKYLPALQGA